MKLPDYKLKTIPEDFIVEEIIDLDKFIDGHANYAYLKITKKNRNTLDVVKELARQTRKDIKEIGFCGNKDRLAVTTQYFSVRSLSKEKSKDIKINDCQISFVGFGKERLNLGSHEKNYFKIVIRDLDKELIKNSDFTDKDFQFINYFDDQRFGKNNVEVGRAMIKKDFKKAVKIIQDEFPEVREYLSKEPTDFVGALLKVPKKLLSLYLHSYQSFLWNIAASEFIIKNCHENRIVEFEKEKLAFTTSNIQNVNFPLVGYGTEFEDKKIEGAFSDIFREEKITQRDFIIRSMPNFSLDTNDRDLVVETKISDFSISDDDLNNDKKMIHITFDLPKGSYATMLIKSLISRLS